MIGGLLQQARTDFGNIAAGGGFQVQATLSTPAGITPAFSLPVTGLATGTWMVFEQLQSGKPVNSTSNSFTIPIGQLIAGSYPYRNDRQMPHIVGHQVIVVDPAGNLAGTYKITEQHPNATLGVIVCILGYQA